MPHDESEALNLPPFIDLTVHVEPFIITPPQKNSRLSGDYTGPAVSLPPHSPKTDLLVIDSLFGQRPVAKKEIKIVGIKHSVAFLSSSPKLEASSFRSLKTILKNPAGHDLRLIDLPEDYRRAASEISGPWR